MSTYLGVVGFVFPVIALLVLIDGAALVALRARVRDLEHRLDAQNGNPAPERNRAVSPGRQSVEPRAEPKRPHVPQGRTEAPSGPPEHPSTVAMPRVHADPYEPNQEPPTQVADKHPWQETELERWREQQARRTPRRHPEDENR
jgi:hypothetical protein